MFDIYKQLKKKILARKVLNYTGYVIAAVKFITLNWKFRQYNQLREINNFRE